MERVVKVKMSKIVYDSAFMEKVIKFFTYNSAYKSYNNYPAYNNKGFNSR